ncbi:MAG: transglycosylase domain-containing protein [Bacteroidota bacterium]
MTKQNKKQRAKRFRRVVRISFPILILLFIAASIYLGLNIKNGKYGRLPAKKELQNIENAQATEIFTSDGKLMGRYYFVNRNDLEFDQIPDNILHALIATEDARFFGHSGIDYRSLFRVFFKTILIGDRSAGGGSTISQQLAKNLYSRKGEGIPAVLGAKIREMILAHRLEEIFSKNKILQLYLNTVPFGENTYGLKNASQLYFNKLPEELSMNQAATLIGMLKATSTYNPHNFPEKSIQRRNMVLNQLEKYEYLSESELDSLFDMPLNTDYTPIGHNKGIAPYFREYLRPKLEKWCAENKKPGGENYNLYTDGLKIHTTIHSKLQKIAWNAVQEHLPKLQKELNEEYSKSLDQEEIEKLAEKILLRNSSYTKEDLLAPNTGIHKKRPMEIFTWDGPKTVKMSPLDSVKHYLKFLQAGFTAINPKNGDILAWVGGIDHRKFKYDHVTSKRQMGSVFKPIVYIRALQNGIEPCDYFENDSIVYDEFDNWTPANADKQYGGVYSMQGALVNSVNTVTVQLLMEAGIRPTRELATKLGFKDSLPEKPSLALGTANSSVLNLAEVYTTFTNKGSPISSRELLRIENNEGETLQEFQSQKSSEEIISKKHLEQLVMMLKNVVERGTAQSINNFSFNGDLAGKTGTTQNHSDGWFIGFTPNLVTVSWVGGEYQEIHFKDIKLGQGAATALPITGYFLEGLSKTNLSEKYTGSFKYTSIDTSSYNCEDYREKPPGLLEKLFNIKLFEKDDSSEENEDKDEDEKPGLFKRIFDKIKSN